MRSCIMAQQATILSTKIIRGKYKNNEMAYTLHVLEDLKLLILSFVCVTVKKVLMSSCFDTKETLKSSRKRHFSLLVY